MARFTDKTALVTGAASGIGRATAERLASEGARLVLVDRDPVDLPGATSHRFDITDEVAWNALALPPLDLAVVNAGVSGAGAIADLDYAEWRRILAVNLDGAFLTLRAAMRAMPGPGAIVVTASASGMKAEPGTGAYAASKAGAIQLAKVAAKEGAPRRLRVNAIAPGGVETPIWRGMDFFREMIAETGSEAAAFTQLAGIATPLGRYATAEEIAAQILFLLSDDCGGVTGSVFVSDGGYTL